VTDRRSLLVPEGVEGERLDAALARMTGMSRTVAAQLVGSGAVQLDGHPASKSTRVTAGSWVEVSPPDPGDTAKPVPWTSPVSGLRVIYHDEDIIVVDKPVGVAAHPSPGWSGPTVVAGIEAVGFRVAAGGPAERQGIVHRLDVGTSGLMVIAASERAYSVLKQAFRDREVDKTYHAVAQGYLDPLRGTIDAPVGRHPKADYRFAVVAGGKPSITHYDSIEVFPAASLLEIRLETGRTHQIRVHLSALRHPCVGDMTYGADPALADRLGLRRQWLHAVRLSFIHPTTGVRVEYISAYPADLDSALELLRE
jgi:23S rRNA pseudouridine1911/1915/1917 synthase